MDRGPPSGRKMLGYNPWLICMRAMNSVAGRNCSMGKTAVSSLAGADIGCGMACVATNYGSRIEYRDGFDASCSAKWEDM